jgi:hypothetical protein
MEQDLDPKNDSLGVILGVKGQYAQKKMLNGRIAPRWKAYASKNSPTSNRN